jgi:hypothetical protein
MRSFFQNKLWVILLATLALGALTVLALSLNEIPFKAAQHYSPKETAELQPVSTEEMIEALQDVQLWKQLVLWGLLALLAVLVGLLLSPELRRRFFRMLIRTALTVIAIFYLLRNYGDRFLSLLQPFTNQEVMPNEVANAQPLPTFQPPQVSSTFSYIVSFAFALLTIVLLWFIVRSWKKYVTLHPGEPLQEIARIARNSLHDLSSGRDSSDVIINCYLRMSDVVADKRQLQREVAMTPHEFALRLERAGLPGDAVRRLTRLFEMVRYGDRKSAPKDVTEAVSCLNTILHYCGETI